MNIVVCVKWVISTDCAIKVENGAIIDRGLYRVVNPYDLIAVEEAVRLRELHKNGEVTLVGMVSPSSEIGLRRCLAIGADKGIVLWDSACEGSDSYATALVLAQAIKSLSYDLVLCGQKAVDVEEGQVGAFLAEFLNIPMVTAVTAIDTASDSDKVRIHRKLERGNREIVETKLPALLTVETGLNKPRYPSLRAVFAARKKEIKRCSLETFGLSCQEVGLGGSKTRVVSLSAPKLRPKKLFVPDSKLPAAERLRLLMSGGVTEKEGKLLLEGEPQQIASKVVRFLSEQNLLPQ